jgi:signal transduction histidine kinase
MTPKRRFGLRAKFLVLIAALLLVVFSLITALLLSYTSRTLRSNLLKEAKAFAELATAPIGSTFTLYQDSGRVRIVQQIEKFMELGSNIDNVAVVGIDGNILFTQRETPEIRVDKAAAASFTPTYVTRTGRLEQVVSPYLENFGLHRYAVVYSISNDSIDRSIAQIAGLILLSGILALVATTGATYVLLNRAFLRPLQTLSRTAILISQGNLDQQIKLERNDEIADVASSVNTMAEALKADIAKLKEVDAMKSEFMMIASHNLRTPLTVINGYIDTMRILKLSDDVKKMVASMAANSRRLGILAENILTVSSIEAGQQTIVKDKGDIGDALRSLMTEFGLLAKEKSLAFTSAIPTTRMPASLSLSHFRAAVWNLLDNALKFNKPGGRIRLEVKPAGDKALIVVSDTGIGIDAKEMDSLFTKFHRGTSTLEYNYEGTGIGLYITKLIVEQHGGTVKAQSTPGVGTTMTITVPLLGTTPPPAPQAKPAA